MKKGIRNRFLAKIYVWLCVETIQGERTDYGDETRDRRLNKTGGLVERLFMVERRQSFFMV